MRSAARKEETPGRDLTAEAVSLIREGARLRAQNQRQMDMLTAAALASPRDCAEIERACHEMVLTGIQVAANTAALDGLADALHDAAAATYAADAFAGLAVQLEDEARGRQVPAQRRPPGRQGPLMLVHDGAADLG